MQSLTHLLVGKCLIQNGLLTFQPFVPYFCFALIKSAKIQQTDTILETDVIRSFITMSFPLQSTLAQISLDTSKTWYSILSTVGYNITIKHIHRSASHRPTGSPQGGINTQKESQAADQAAVIATQSGL